MKRRLPDYLWLGALVLAAMGCQQHGLTLQPVELRPDHTRPDRRRSLVVDRGPVLPSEAHARDTAWYQSRNDRLPTATGSKREREVLSYRWQYQHRHTYSSDRDTRFYDHSRTYERSLIESVDR